LHLRESVVHRACRSNSALQVTLSFRVKRLSFYPIHFTDE
jgi:hypothetical protein